MLWHATTTTIVMTTQWATILLTAYTRIRKHLLGPSVYRLENWAKAEFAKAQEAGWKDTERAFVVLQARFVIVRVPSRMRGTWTWSSSLTMLVPGWSHEETRIKYKHFLRHTRTLRKRGLKTSFSLISFNTIGIGTMVDSVALLFISFHFLFEPFVVILIIVVYLPFV
jgi:hypothetical protein